MLGLQTYKAVPHMKNKKSFLGFLSSGSAPSILVVALLFALASFGTFWLAEWVEHLTGSAWSKLAGPLRQTAHLLLTVGGVQFLIRTKIWKDAIDSVSERLQVKQAALDSGLTHYWQYDAVPWSELFENAADVTIVAISARSILVERLATIRTFLSRPDTKLRLILSNFNDNQLMARFDAEFKESAGTRAKKMREAIGELMKVVGLMTAKAKTRVEIRLSSSRVPYSVYRFDDKILFVPYMMEPVRDASRIPALLFSDGGVAAKYLIPDLAYLLKSDPVAHADLVK